MAPTARQIIDNDGRFREEFEDSSAGYIGLREYLVSGAASLDEAVRGAISGLPNRGDPWEPGMDTCVALTRRAEWMSVNQSGEVLGAIKVSVPYGPLQFTTFNETPSPQRVGQTWSECDNATIAQAQMFGFVPGTNTILQAAIDNGRGINVDIGYLVLRISKTYAANAIIPVGDFLSLSRPPKVNSNAISIPSLWGKNNVLNFAAGQLLYKKFEAPPAPAGLIVVTHEIWASSDWKYSWVQESEDGEPLGRNDVDIYESADFTGLW